jgi:hypothetical protein
VSQSLSERYPDLDNILGSFFPGDDSLDAEVDEMVTTLEDRHLDMFADQVGEILAMDLPDDEIDAFVFNSVNWDLGGGRHTLAELARMVAEARGATS